jgi:serine/threonine protein kinase
VYEAINRHTDEKLAVKVFKKDVLPAEDIESLIEEAETLKSLEHENIIKFKHVSKIS